MIFYLIPTDLRNCHTLKVFVSWNLEKVPTFPTSEVNRPEARQSDEVSCFYLAVVVFIINHITN